VKSVLGYFDEITQAVQAGKSSVDGVDGIDRRGAVRLRHSSSTSYPRSIRSAAVWQALLVPAAFLFIINRNHFFTM
jgi:hypothetical protein